MPGCGVFPTEGIEGAAVVDAVLPVLSRTTVPWRKPELEITAVDLRVAAAATP